MDKKTIAKILAVQIAKTADVAVAAVLVVKTIEKSLEKSNAN